MDMSLILAGHVTQMKESTEPIPVEGCHLGMDDFAWTTRSDLRNIRTELLTQGEASHGDYFFEMDGLDTSVAIFQGGEYITTCDTFEDLKDFIRELN